jgi:DNA-binding protein Fis
VLRRAARTPPHGAASALRQTQWRSSVKDQLESLIVQLVEGGVPFSMALEEFEKKYICRVLERTRWNQSRAARLLGIHRNTLSRKIDEYRITRNGHYAPR